MIDQAQFIYSPLQKKAIKDGAERNFRDFRDFKYRSTVKINKFIDKFTSEKNLQLCCYTK